MPDERDIKPPPAGQIYWEHTFPNFFTLRDDGKQRAVADLEANIIGINDLSSQPPVTTRFAIPDSRDVVTEVEARLGIQPVIDARELGGEPAPALRKMAADKASAFRERVPADKEAAFYLQAAAKELDNGARIEALSPAGLHARETIALVRDALTDGKRPLTPELAEQLSSAESALRSSRHDRFEEVASWNTEKAIACLEQSRSLAPSRELKDRLARIRDAAEQERSRDKHDPGRER